MRKLFKHMVLFEKKFSGVLILSLGSKNNSVPMTTYTIKYTYYNCDCAYQLLFRNMHR